MTRGSLDLGLNCRHRRRRGAEVRFVAQRGKGSHGTLYYGERKTIVKDRKKELGSGLLA
jgi:mRNA interferase HicA